MKNLYKKGLSIILFLCMTLTISIGFSQTQFMVVPTGGAAGTTNGTGGDPVCRYFNSIRYQVVYTAAELIAAGMDGQTAITSLAWNVTESSVSLGNYTINMGNTAATNSAAHNVDAITNVKTAFTYSVVLGYNDITFDTPFVWNGTSNLVIEICTGAANPFTSPYGGVEAKTGVTSGSRNYRVDGASACATNTSGALTTKPYVRLTGTLLNPTPPVPFQIAPTVSCTLGASLDVVGTPAPSVTWYWQSAASGTSMANPYTGPYSVFANATYYLRGYNSTTLNWSNASSVVVTDMPIALAPPAAVALVNPSCVPLGSTLSIATPPVGTDYFWQGSTLNGTSNALNASTPYAYSASGTYYVSAYDNATSCWSLTTPTVVTVNSIIPGPAVVAVSSVNACTGDLSIPVNASVPVEILSGTCSVNATASGTDNTNVTATVNNFTCAPATITGATLNASIGAYCGAPYNYYYYSIIVNGVTVATQQCNQTGFNLTPYLPLTSVSIVSYDDPLDGVGDGVTMNATVNLTYNGPSTPQPAYSLTWFDAASAGTTLGTGSPLETVGTSVLPAAVFGTYNFYVESNLSGCSSATRQLVTVNIADVNAVLTAVNATCNGGNNGSFTLGAVSCGATPFTYSVNGGAYGAIPTNLTAGTYSVIIKDNGGLMSPPISVVVTEPGAPTALAASNVLYFTADLSWTASGNETQWNVEYGPTGFTPGSGISSVENATNLSLLGLTAETCYDVYVSAVCGVSSATTMINFCTNTGFFTYDNGCGPGYFDISGTGLGTDLGDDNSVGFTLPWTLNYQGSPVTNMSISNNGGILFNTLTTTLNWTNAAMAGAATGLYPYWDDLLSTGSNTVYTEVIGTAPNRQAIIEWNVSTYGAPTSDYAFQVVIDEATDEIYYIYDNVDVGDVTRSFGATATIGAAGPVDPQVSYDNTTYLTNNSCVHFYNALCPNPINVVAQSYPDEVILTWSAGLYGETDWTVIYGPTGFDPLTSGTTITTSLPNADILGLNQLTTYDFYVYSECMLDNITSGGLLITVQTLPFCSNPSGINTATGVDSLFTSWSWLASSPTYPSTGFNVQYGEIGFNLWSGTVVNANNNYSDTTVNTAFLAGGVYEVYVQAVCGTDTSNYMGPFTFIMPLSNDSVCGAEMLQVDGTVYVFNNTGATSQAGESALITGSNPAGYNGTELPMMTWGVPIVEGSNWYSFIAPASGNLRFSGEDEDFFASQIAIYELTNCGDFTTFNLMGASDQTDLAVTTKLAPNFTICGLTPGNTYYVLHDAWSNGFGGAPIYGQYSIKMTPIVLQAGSVATMANVCTGDTTNLFTTITGYDANGVWTAVLASANTQVTDSLFVSSGLAYQVFDFEYRMTDGCAYDTIISQVEIYNFSHAGIDGAFTVCKNEPVDLLSGLSGNVDLGGSWYDPSNNVMPSSSITASSIPGMFNYDYITGNGVCPDDTANVLVTVNGACDYLDIQEMYFGAMSLSPNPTNGLVYISNSGSSEVFNYEVTDVDGRVIATKLAAINGTTTTEVNLTGKVTGMYMIRVYNDNAMKVFRVILQ